jgi:hypothetical protein
MVPVNYWAVIVAAIASMVIGFLWYGPVFGKMWSRLMGWSEQAMADMKAKGGMGSSYLIMFIGSLVMAYVLAHSLIFAATFTQTSGVSAGLVVGFWNWLGFIAPVTLGSVLWEKKSWKLWILNNAYYLVTLLVMGIILAHWLPAIASLPPLY